MATSSKGQDLLRRAQSLRAILVTWGAITVLAWIAAPASAQLRSAVPDNSVLIDLGAIEGAGPAPRVGVLAPGTAAPSGNLMLPPPAAPQSRLLVPGGARSEPSAPSVSLRPPEARRPPPRDTSPAPSRSVTRGKAPMEPVERRDEPRVDTAQRTPLPSVALPAPGPTSLDTPPSAAVAPPPAPATPSVPPALAVAPPPPAAQPQMTAAAAPSSTQSIPKTTAKSSTKSTGPTPLPAVEPPKPADATPPPPATPAAPSLAAQPTPAPPQQAALPERAPTPRTATPPAPESMEIRFAAGDANLPDDGKARLDKLADNLKANEASRLQLLAYAGEDQISPSKARRLSLSRALAVRSYLIAKGIRSTRIDVRALGDQVPGGDPNRVDLKVTDR